MADERRTTPRAVSLLSLPDDLLARVAADLDPLPDLASLAAVCRRLRAVVDGARESLTTIYVCSATAAAAAGGRRDVLPPPARLVVASLAAAAAAARPGDTLRLAPGDHAPPRECGLVIDRPLRLVGAGAAATRVTAPLPRRDGRAPPTLTLAARGAGVAVHDITLDGAPSTPALLHVSGGAALAGCRLRCAPCALGHLFSAAVSTAVAAPPGAPPAVREAAPGGCLTLSETVVSGTRGGAAVRAAGSGGLAAVRAVPLPGGGAMLWCRVDAADGAGGGGSLGLTAADGGVLAGGGARGKS